MGGRKLTVEVKKERVSCEFDYYVQCGNSLKSVCEDGRIEIDGVCQKTDASDQARYVKIKADLNSVFKVLSLFKIKAEE